MRLTPLLSLAPLALAGGQVQARNQQQPLQIYLHPTPSNVDSAVPTLSADQAKAVLAHHLGENIGDFDEIPNDEGMWGHLMGMWGDKMDGAEMKARVVIIDGGVEAQDVLPSTLTSEPSFYMYDSDSTFQMLQPYIDQASTFIQDILAQLPALTKAFKDTFEMAGTKAASVLGHELSCLTAMADSIPWIDTSKHGYSWDSVRISGLKDVEKDGEVWETGRQGVKAGLESMTTPNSPPLLLIIRPGPNVHSSTKRSFTSLAKSKSNTTLASTCYSSNETCSSSTSCNGRGQCSLNKKLGDEECWGCKCSSGYAGVECQKEDYSVPFAIIVFSTLFLMIMAGGSVMLLMTIGDTKLPSTLNLAIGTNMKRD